MKKLLSVILTATLILGCVLPAFAASRTANEDEKEYYTALFNSSVNSIKTEMPSAKVTFNNYVPEGGITSGGTSKLDEVDEMAVKYLMPVLEGLFNNRSSLAKSFIKTLLGSEGNTVDTLKLSKGALRNKSLPIYGEKYMSSLSAADDYKVTVDEDDGAKHPSRMIFTFDDMPLSQAKESSIAKVFSLPSGTLDPTIISGSRTELTSRLDDAQLQNFNIKNAQILTRYDGDGALTYYGSAIEYSFSLSFYDCMNLISAVIGYNFYLSVINAVSTILENIGRDEISATEILKERQIYFSYICVVEINDIDYRDRLFGDIDDDKEVTSSDARAALRHAVKLDPITASNDQIYADVDFDGEITASDARLILRMAVGIDETFTQVPDGCSIKIVKIEEDVAPPEEENGTDNSGGNNGSGSGGIAGIFDGFDPGISLEDIVNAIMNAIGDTEGDAEDTIRNIIDAIRRLIEEARDIKP